MRLWPRIDDGAELTDNLVVICTACPTCHAGQGEHCRWPGEPPKRDAVHTARWDRGEALKRREESPVP
jgi:hypothetical protein